jgi:3-hydroxyacyl-[acyl-carrier-protein] dehydratase
MPDGFLIPLQPILTPEGVEASCRVPPDSHWFSGHFPDNPIFPALGMIGLVDGVLHAGGVAQPEGGLSGRLYKRIRFRQVVRPGEEIVVSISPQEPRKQGRFRFNILKGPESISEGVVLAGGPASDPLVRDPDRMRIVERADVPIEALVPHRDRMRLVDVFEGHDHDRDGITRTSVRGTWPLCDGQAVNPHVVIELVAQATAAMAGWDDVKQGKSVGFGYIVGIKNAWICTEPIPVGSPLTVKTRKVVTQGNYGVFSGSVYRETRTWGEVVLQVFRPDEA